MPRTYVHRSTKRRVSHRPPIHAFTRNRHRRALRVGALQASAPALHPVHTDPARRRVHPDRDGQAARTAVHLPPGALFAFFGGGFGSEHRHRGVLRGDVSDRIVLELHRRSAGCRRRAAAGAAARPPDRRRRRGAWAPCCSCPSLRASTSSTSRWASDSRPSSPPSCCWQRHLLVATRAARRSLPVCWLSPARCTATVAAPGALRTWSQTARDRLPVGRLLRAHSTTATFRRSSLSRSRASVRRARRSPDPRTRPLWFEPMAASGCAG